MILVTRGHCLVFHRSRSQDSVVWTPCSLVDSVDIGPQQEDGTIHQVLGLSEGLRGNAQRLAKQLQPAQEQWGGNSGAGSRQDRPFPQAGPSTPRSRVSPGLIPREVPLDTCSPSSLLHQGFLYPDPCSPPSPSNTAVPSSRKVAVLLPLRDETHPVQRLVLI